jgi:hypothetical protein
VSGFVPQVHHDLAFVLEVVHLALQAGESRVSEIEGDADHGLPVGTAPFVGEVADRAEVLETLALELAVELVHKALDRRAFEAQAELADALAKQLAELGRSLLKFGHEGRMLAARPAPPQPAQPGRPTPPAGAPTGGRTQPGAAPTATPDRGLNRPAPTLI